MESATAGLSNAIGLFIFNKGPRRIPQRFLMNIPCLLKHIQLHILMADAFL